MSDILLSSLGIALVFMIAITQRIRIFGILRNRRMYYDKLYRK